MRKAIRIILPIILRLGIWIWVVHMIAIKQPLHYTPPPDWRGTIEVPLQYFIDAGAIQARAWMVQVMLTIGWSWNLYLLFCDMIPLLPKKLIMQEIKESLRGGLISMTIVLCAVMGYMLA